EQYRPAVEDYTLELPAGYVEKREYPQQAATRELFEETGFHCDNVNLLGCLHPDTGRLANRQWCFFGNNATPVDSPTEAGVTKVLLPKHQLKEYITTSKFNHSLHLAALFLAVVNHKISL
ncbi:MAG: NUDIX hydrolase, partial [Bacteroidia bacterium]|nr:NUDIX hydrolase [Bacteroidia bacterium]